MQSVAYEPPMEPEIIDAQPDHPRLNVLYPRSVNGLLKIAEIILSLITLICVGSAGFNPSTTGWLNFVCASTLVLCAVFFFLYFFHIIHTLPGPWGPIEFLILLFCCVFYVLSMIIAAASNSISSSGRAATAVFCIITAIVIAVECFLRFRVVKEKGRFVISTTTVLTSRSQQQPQQQQSMPAQPYDPPHSVNSVAAVVNQNDQLHASKPNGNDDYIMP